MAAPNTPQDIVDRIRKMERQLRELNGRVNIRPALNTISGGDVVISNGGGLAVNDPDGTEVFRVGHWEGREWPSAEYGVTIRRQTGEVAISTTTGNFGDDNMQEVQIYDRKGNVILGDKSETGWGLSRPYIPVPMAPAWLDFTHSTWFNTYYGFWHVQNPVLNVNFALLAPSGTTAEARIMVNAQEQIGPTVSVTDGSETVGEYYGPNDHGLAYGNRVTLGIEARRTAGTGTCRVYLYGFHGSD